MEKETPARKINPWILYVIVAISGAAVLAVEILGTRILGPHYGVSLFLWSALITVALSALSVGYAVGGRMADRKASLTRIAVILAMAGIWLIMVPLLKRPVLWISGSLGLRMAVIVAGFILFFPPLFALGMISPYAIKLRTVSLGEVGRSAGNLYSVSTAASVVAALLTGFILIPKVGVSILTISIGIMLLLTAAFAAMLDRRSFAKRSGLALLFILCAAAALFMNTAPARTSGEGSIRAFEQSPYAQIMVVEYSNARFLLIDGAIHTFTDIESNETLFSYVNVVDISRYMFSTPGDALLIGLGGGSVAKHFSRGGWSVDGVEIDPVVVKMAREHFDLEKEEANIHTMDGRQFLNGTDKIYDVVVMDAFGSGSVPFHLITREAFGLVKSRLDENGVLAINLQSIGWKSTIVRSVTATLRSHFTEVLALPIAEPPNKLGNIIILASNRPLETVSELPDPDSRFSADYDRIHAWNNRFTPDISDVPVLTDELNPVELWSEEINLAERRELNVYFKDLGLLW
ncbi:MAG: fused MFS/spermidine synthase [Bacteroidales bacterium]|nr:fused MFS/spermidine synthase [Candidatus Latescibacterota bacterium]